MPFADATDPTDVGASDAPDLLYLRHGLRWADETLAFYRYFED